MAMNNISTLATSEQDSYSAYQDKTPVDKESTSDSGFLSLLHHAEQSSEQPNSTDVNAQIDSQNTVVLSSEQQRSDDSTVNKIFVDIEDDKNKGVEGNDLPNKELTDKELVDEGVLLSGDLLLAQINSAQTINTSVKKYSSAIEKIEVDLKGNNKKPVDDVTPIIISPQKVNTDNLQDEQASNIKIAVEKNALTEVDSPIKALVKGNKELELIVNQHKPTSGLDKSVESLTSSQLDKLNAQIQSLDKPNSNVATLKQMIEQYVTESESIEPESIEPESKPNFNLEINALTKAEKQALVSQLNSYIKSVQPQGEELASLKQMVNDLTASIDEALTPPLKVKSIAAGVSDKLNTSSNSQTHSEKFVVDDKTQESTKPAILAKNEELAKPLEGNAKEGSRNNANTVEQLTNRATQLFTQITNAFSSGQASTLSSYDTLSYEQSITDMQALQSQQLQSTAQIKQVSIDPGVMQAINIVKSDAAKLLQERVSSMLNINNKEAEIRLDPPEMGSMQIRIRSDAEQAQINFVVQNQQAKEALEQSLPRLREMLAQQGIEMGESTISYGDSGSGADQSEENGQGRLANKDSVNDENDEQVGNGAETSRQQTSSSIDYYA
ncbi:flagellar hook-length control protein FliK [Pseudoalteromonas aliena]|uniref:Flagellar hook-length control protein FliK n=1 Tax=Pseudoalteromonas aliena SW19 TaxID=1314866 RepID=A0ABR9E499_9GAMM|nr:flagellar hook-length control protein FliK [Pseudoalteromonas aliena]MBE0360234.1 flagellar hook-length control protein FliK [Pseudoalteromonas aliena SW19]